MKTSTVVVGVVALLAVTASAGVALAEKKRSERALAEANQRAEEARRQAEAAQAAAAQTAAEAQRVAQDAARRQQQAEAAQAAAAQTAAEAQRAAQDAARRQQQTDAALALVRQREEELARQRGDIASAHTAAITTNQSLTAAEAERANATTQVTFYRTAVALAGRARKQRADYIRDYPEVLRVRLSGDGLQTIPYSGPVQAVDENTAEVTVLRARQETARWNFQPDPMTNVRVVTPAEIVSRNVYNALSGTLAEAQRNLAEWEGRLADVSGRIGQLRADLARQNAIIAGGSRVKG